jgi:hypothetical protein
MPSHTLTALKLNLRLSHRRLLNKTGTLISYFLIASLLFMYAATLNHALDDLTLLGGTLINLGGAVALWGIRAAAVHIFLLPL